MARHPIPIAAIDAHTAVLGKTGTGKTYTARGLAEQLLDAGRQVVILDPTGAWWGLRSHYEIPIFGGEHGDIAISDASGEAVAAAIVDQHTSAIVDLKLLAKESGAAMRRFVSAFAKRLKAKPAGALYFIIDEADEFLPQNIGHGDTQLFGHLRWMVRRGRIDGFRVMMVTQRPAEIAKAVLTQIETLVCHRVTAPQDRKAIEDWVKGHSDSGQARQVLQSLAGLDRGEAWIWAPEQDLLERASIPRNRSHDSSATPDADAGVIEQPALASIDLTAIAAALTPDSDERRHPNDKIPSDPKAALDKGSAVGRMLKDRDDRIAELEDALAAAKRASADWHERYAAARIALREISDIAQQEPDVSVLDEEPVAPSQPPAPKIELPFPDDLAPRHRKLLDALAWCEAFLRREAVERGILAWMADYSPKSSGFEKALSAIRTAGLVDYPSGGQVRLTNEGRAIAVSPKLRPTYRELVSAIRARLEPRFVKLLDALLEREGPMTRSELASATDYSSASSGFEKALSRLRSLGLVDYPEPGCVALSGPLYRNQSGGSE